jgi:nitrous oxidase accessory protein NosD
MNPRRACDEEADRFTRISGEYVRTIFPAPTVQKYYSFIIVFNRPLLFTTGRISMTWKWRGCVAAAMLALLMTAQLAMPLAAGAGAPAQFILREGPGGQPVYLGSNFLGLSNGSRIDRPVLLVTEGLLEHAPITIDGNAQFSSQAVDEGWPGNGSAANPYRIGGYQFKLLDNQTGISIANVSLFFSVEQCAMGPRDSAVHYVGDGVNVTDSNLVRVAAVQALFLHIGLLVQNASNVEIRDCHLADSGSAQAVLLDCHQIHFSNDTFEGSSVGLAMEGCSSFLLSNNSFMGMEFAGVEMQGVQNITFSSNQAVGCSLVAAFGAVLDTISLPQNNTINGRPIYFQRGVDFHGTTIGNGYGLVWLYQCSNATVRGMYLDEGPYAVSIESCSNIALRDCQLGSGKIAVSLLDSTSCLVDNCTLASGGFVGTALSLQRTSACTVTGCKIYNGGWGVFFMNADANWISHSSISSFLIGVAMDAASDENQLIGNELQGNFQWAIATEGNHNTFLSNYFLDNGEASPATWTPVAMDHGSNNLWNSSGTLHGFGNYWSNFTSPAHDGILDLPVPISSQNDSIFDRCALAYPPSTPSAPRNLSASAGNGIVLAWQAPANLSGSALSGYTVYRNAGAGWVKLSEVPTSSYVDHAVTAGSTYQYRIAAYNLLGEGNSSQQISATYGVSSQQDWAMLALALLAIGALLLLALWWRWRT